jgi:hypothetical protein
MLMAAAAAMARLIGGWFRGCIGVAIVAALALGALASTAAPLQLVTDQLLPLENLSDAEAPGSAPKFSDRSSPPWARRPLLRSFPGLAH